MGGRSVKVSLESDFHILKDHSIHTLQEYLGVIDDTLVERKYCTYVIYWYFVKHLLGHKIYISGPVKDIFKVTLNDLWVQVNWLSAHENSSMIKPEPSRSVNIVTNILDKYSFLFFSIIRINIAVINKRASKNTQRIKNMEFSPLKMIGLLSRAETARFDCIKSL